MSTTTTTIPLEFTVYGKPAQQGSKSAFVRNGRAIMFEANAKAKAEWRQQVVAVAMHAMNGRSLIEGPVQLDIVFMFRRPKSHYGTGRNASLLKDSAPKDHVHTPDLDKLVRNVGDGLTGTVLRDDSQVCVLIANRRWTETVECAVVRITELTSTSVG